MARTSKKKSKDLDEGYLLIKEVLSTIEKKKKKRTKLNSNEEKVVSLLNQLSRKCRKLGIPMFD